MIWPRTSSYVCRLWYLARFDHEMTGGIYTGILRTSESTQSPIRYSTHHVLLLLDLREKLGAQQILNTGMTRMIDEPIDWCKSVHNPHKKMNYRRYQIATPNCIPAGLHTLNERAISDNTLMHLPCVRSGGCSPPRALRGCCVCYYDGSYTTDTLKAKPISGFACNASYRPSGVHSASEIKRASPT